MTIPQCFSGLESGIGRTTCDYKESQLLAEYNEKLKIDAPWPAPLCQKQKVGYLQFISSYRLVAYTNSFNHIVGGICKFFPGVKCIIKHKRTAVYHCSRVKRKHSEKCS